ncbi:MAG: C45 family peptidase [Pseudomonadota bacterium]|nr:C45 family peptidase [Pseudomonadota bacterium]
MDRWDAREIYRPEPSAGSAGWGVQDPVSRDLGAVFLPLPQEDGPYRATADGALDGTQMDLTFQSFSEAAPGPKWQALFQKYWPAYRAWYLSDGLEQRATWLACKEALETYMPRLMPTYDALCDLAGGKDLPSRFLSLWKPPAYISGCSQVVWLGDGPKLIRNYDYSPALMDGVIMESAWNGTRVIAMTDCLWGVLDGVNEKGLAVSLTFGGRRTVGEGFGIPVILRNILEFCETAEEAGEMLAEIPTHMAYNVTAVDRSGRFRTAYLSPGSRPIIKSVPYATNHQGRIEWHDHARATATLEREQFLRFRLEDDSLTFPKLVEAFRRQPLYTNAYSSGFGTIYTAVYDPIAGTAHYLFPDGTVKRFGFGEVGETAWHVPIDGSGAPEIRGMDWV